MFIIIPLVLILTGIVGIGAIISRKSSYLKKLDAGSHEFGPTVLHDFAPEVLNNINTAKLKEYRQSALVELEKFLRRLRLLSLKLDRASESLIKRIRRVHLSSGYISPNLPTGELTTPKAPSVVHDIDVLKPDTEVIEKAKAAAIQRQKDNLRKKEQALIIEIAKNPKNTSLYEELGDLYMKTGDYADAVESYKTAQALDPTNPTLLKKYSQAADKKAA